MITDPEAAWTGLQSAGPRGSTFLPLREVRTTTISLLTWSATQATMPGRADIGR